MSLTEQTAESRPTQPAPRVLIVDDDTSLRDQLSAYLGSRGIDCAFAADGRQALAALEDHRPEVLLLDIRLPDTSGVELAARAAALNPAPKIILMSGYDDAVVEANKANLEVFAVIEKPVPLRIVARFLHQALQMAA
jgi:DNA-binding NtrC family response regulator